MKLKLLVIMLICMLILVGCKTEPPAQGVPEEDSKIVPKPLIYSPSFALPKKSSEITGSVVGPIDCIPATTVLGFHEQPNTNQDYVRIQIYDPIGSSSLRILTAETGAIAVKQTAELLVKDLMDHDLFKIKAICDDCGQEISYSLNGLDYQNMLQPNLDAWSANMQYMCTRCPLSRVTIVEDSVLSAAEIESYKNRLENGVIPPEKVLEDLLGKKADFYDGLPRMFWYTQNCPDYIPRISFSFFMPVFKDEHGQNLKFPFNWGKMEHEIDWDKLGSYSYPIRWNTIAVPMLPNGIQYQSYPEAYVYYKARLKSIPEDIVNQTFYFRGEYEYEAPVTKTIGDEIYRFDEWQVEKGAEVLSWNRLTLKKFTKATAKYRKTGDVVPVVDLVIKNLNVEYRDDGFYHLLFELHNQGSEDFTQRFDTKASRHGKTFATIPHYGGIPAGESVALDNTYTDSMMFDPNDDYVYVVLEVDTENEVVETNEDNNLEAKQFPRYVSLKPDIVVRKILATPGRPAKNEEVAITFRIENIGEAKAESAKIRVRLEEEEITTATVDNLAAGTGFDTGFKTKFEHCGDKILSFSVQQVRPAEASLVGNDVRKQITITCEEESCSSKTNYYECASGSCPSGSYCQWFSSQNKCECTHHKGQCLNMCRPNHGTCTRGACPYPRTFHQQTGDQNCVDDHSGEQNYRCCCNIPEEDESAQQPETQTPTSKPLVKPPVKEPLKQEPSTQEPQKQIPTKRTKLSKFPRLTGRTVRALPITTFNWVMMISAILVIAGIVYVNSRRK